MFSATPIGAVIADGILGTGAAKAISRPCTACRAATNAHPGSQDRVRDAMRSLFGLTAAEARVACLVAAGSGVRTAAADLNVAPPTVRTQLLRAYAKTGTCRQAELARLVAQLDSVAGPG